MREQERDTEETPKPLSREGGGAPMAVGLATVRPFPLKRLARKEGSYRSKVSVVALEP